jgi:hypothetical protein
MPAGASGGAVTRPGAGGAPALRLLPPLAAVVASGVALGWFQVFDHDVFWHLSAGQQILRSGGLPDRNLFSATFPDHPWLDLEWLFQVVIAACFQAGGWLGVALFKVLVVCLTGVTVFAAVLAAGAGPWSAAALAAGVLAVMRLRITERPHLVSYLFFAAILCVLARRARGGRAAIWALPPLFALWSNIHPELLAGLLFLGAVVVGEALDRRRAGGPVRDRGDLLPPVLLLCSAATLANPGGWRVLQYPLLHLGLGSFIDLTEFRSSFGYPVPLFWLTLGTLAATLSVRRARVTLAEALPVGGLAVLAVLFQRTIPYFAIAAAPLLGRHLGGGSRAEGERRRETPALVVGVAVVLAWTLSLGRPPFVRPGHGVNAALFPVAAADFLAAESLPPKLYNPYGEGGYLIHRLWPRLGVFQDGRFVQAYPRSFFQQLALVSSPGDWSALLEAHGVSTALVRRGDLERMGFGNRGWGIVFWDDEWCVLVRRVAPTAGLLARLEYTAYLPGFPLPQDAAGREAAVGEMRRNQAARRARSVQVATDLGVTLALLHRFREAIASLDEATRLAPRSADAWAKLGFAHAAGGERAAAVAALQTALRLDPAHEAARRNLAAVNALPGGR